MLWCPVTAQCLVKLSIPPRGLKMSLAAYCSRLHMWHPGTVRVHSTDGADLGEGRDACAVCSWAHVLVDAGGCTAGRSSACHFVRSGGLNTTAAEPL